MKLRLLILLILPALAMAQEVKPVESADYMALIKNNTAAHKTIDSSNNINTSKLHFSKKNFTGGFLIKEINISKNSTLKLQPVINKVLFIGGTASSTAALQRINQQPALQQQYVQGRSANGNLIWQGPHTNELFSYGPNINTLEFDGMNYPYDANGRLVAAGTGNGRKAMIYTPSIFRTAALFSNAITLQAKYRVNYQQLWSVALKAGQSNEGSFIKYNTNNAAYFSVAPEITYKGFTVTGSYNYRQENFSNNNRDGFLNRVYQNALLTPVSFDNRQGNTIGTAQRSYSQYADNPYFLLENNNHAFLQQHYTASINIEKRLRNGKIRLSQSCEELQQQSNESYQPGTAFFESGIPVNRNTHDANYFLNFNAEKIFYGNDDRLRGTLSGNYIYNNNRSGINYSTAHTAYTYQRSSNDAAVNYAETYRSDNGNLESGLFLTDKIYTSSTAATNNFFLPAVSFFTKFNRIFDGEYLSAKIKAGFNRFNSELPINTSFAQNLLTQYTAADAMQHLPLTEVNSFNNLQPIAHKEYTSGVELSYKYFVTLSFDWFNRSTFNDVFPVVANGQLQLANMADHRNRGIEIELNLCSNYYGNNKVHFSNGFSFTSYRSTVTAVRDNYNYTAIAGFSDVHKAIVKGAPLGVIVGNSFLRDAANNMIIGADGFPLVNNTPVVIGNPAPDFIIKMANHVSWKNWELNVDWEWRKGGDIWNGTAALLDYYGRSASSAALRNTTNYIFNGVDVNSKPNTIPVSFYDPSLPVTQNRWMRYGPTGVAESYIQKGDCIRLNNIGISFKPKIKKYLQQLTLSLYAGNLIVWSVYKGADVNQLLNDQPGTSGLDFFNIPSYHSFGFSASLKF